MIPAGTLVVCPNCSTQIAKTKKDLFPLDKIDLEALDFFSYKELDLYEHARFVCYQCRASFFFKGKLHTDKGWMFGNGVVKRNT